jgi:hypothetical protein
VAKRCVEVLCQEFLDKSRYNLPISIGEHWISVGKDADLLQPIMWVVCFVLYVFCSTWCFFSNDLELATNMMWWDVICLIFTISQHAFIRPVTIYIVDSLSNNFNRHNRFNNYAVNRTCSNRLYKNNVTTRMRCCTQYRVQLRAALRHFAVGTRGFLWSRGCHEQLLHSLLSYVTV